MDNQDGIEENVETKVNKYLETISFPPPRDEKSTQHKHEG